MTAFAKTDVRQRWRRETWEQMAQENPLAAVMTTPDMTADAALSEERLARFFSKGRLLFDQHVRPIIKPGLVVDYGCGPGRILRAVAEAGSPCVGLDVSPTMIELGRRLAPEAKFQVLDAGRSALPDDCAAVVFSFAVVQHIAKLDAYILAFDEMCRILAPGGVLLVQVSCGDLRYGRERPGRTENHQDHSIHYPATGQPFRLEQDNWTGVCIGHELQVRILTERGLVFDGWRTHRADPSKVWWLLAHKPPKPSTE